MIEQSRMFKCNTRLLFITLVLLLNIGALVYYTAYCAAYGYLPAPFIYDKSDTFMDFFNVLYWSYDEGRYTDWKSVYPPLNFLIVRALSYLFGGNAYGDPASIREHNGVLIFGLFFIYLAGMAFVLRYGDWKKYSKSEVFLLYAVFITSVPILFSLERGNLIGLCPVFIAVALSRIGLLRGAAIAVLINIKPYFVLLVLYYLARRNWRGLFVCVSLAGLVFVLTGLILDPNFLSFLANILDFSNNDSVFSLREVMGFPSSISAFSYVLSNPDGALFASDILTPESTVSIISSIESAKLVALLFAVVFLFMKSSCLRDAEIISVIVVVISNLGVWIGGYSYIFYAAIIPVLLKMREWRWYVGILTLISLPLDVLPIVSDNIGEQYSYVSDSYVEILWTLGLGSLLRPMLNILLVAVLVIELSNRKAQL